MLIIVCIIQNLKAYKEDHRILQLFTQKEEEEKFFDFEGKFPSSNSEDIKMPQ